MGAYAMSAIMNTADTFIIAELSANHGHRLETALATVRAAKSAGANAIKLQTYTADTMTIDCDNEYFQIKQGTLWDGLTLYELYKKAFTPWEWHKTIFEEAEKFGLLAFSTPFDSSAVDFLETLNVPLYKIASFEITDIPLIEYVASKHKPMLISTGTATVGEIAEALAACERNGARDVTLLKCTSEYPAKLEDANLTTLSDMRGRFGVKVGVSDHTMGAIVPICAVSLGATVVEKHFILDRTIGGPDAAFSMEPKEFSEMVTQIRNIEKTKGTPTYAHSDAPVGSRIFTRSLFAVENIRAGEKLTQRNIRSIRPGYGLAPKYLPQVLGKKAARAIARGTPLAWDLLE